MLLQEGFDCGPVLGVMTTLLSVAFQEVGLMLLMMFLSSLWHLPPSHLL